MRTATDEPHLVCVGTKLERQVRADLERLAAWSDRSLSAEIRHIVHLHLLRNQIGKQDRLTS
jgi:hypothetical protein